MSLTIQQQTVLTLFVFLSYSAPAGRQTTLTQLPHDWYDSSSTALVVQNGFVSTVIPDRRVLHHDVSVIHTYDGNTRRLLPRAQISGEVLAVYGHQALAVDHDRVVEYDLNSKAGTPARVIRQLVHGSTWDFYESPHYWLLMPASSQTILIEKVSAIPKTVLFPECQDACSYRLFEDDHHTPFVTMDDAKAESGAITSTVSKRNWIINAMSGVSLAVPGDVELMKDNLLLVSQQAPFGCDSYDSTIVTLDMRAHPNVFPATWSQSWTPPAPFTYTVGSACAGERDFEGIIWTAKTKLFLFSGSQSAVFDVDQWHWRQVKEATVFLLRAGSAEVLNSVSRHPQPSYFATDRSVLQVECSANRANIFDRRSRKVTLSLHLPCDQLPLQITEVKGGFLSVRITKTRAIVSLLAR